MSLRLLVIDDENDICELIADVADAAGFETRSVNDPAEVESVLLEFRPDAVMLDLMMPGTDGVELLRTLGDPIKGAAIVLMSGHDARVLNSARRLGTAHGLNVVGIQEKPIDVGSLRTTFELFSGLKQKKETRRAHVEDSIVNMDEVTVFYQPIIDIGSGQVKGLEALARWKHPVHGILAPDMFLEKLDAKSFDALADAVMQIAVRDTAALHRAGFPVAVSINMTAGNLVDLSVPDRLDALCQQHGVPQEKINIEVTEGEAMRDVRRSMDVLTRLRLRGFGVAIDDFGVGYSSLRELQRLPFSVMKMDKSFIMDMADNRDSQIIAHTVIDLGHNLSLKVVAEGVETARVLAMLKERSCDLAQGYLISKPVPYDTLQAWLQENGGVFRG